MSAFQTIGQCISDVKSDLQATNIDQRFSSRYIFSKLVDSAYKFLKQPANYKYLYAEITLVRHVACEDMVEIRDDECCLGFLKPYWRTKHKIEGFIDISILNNLIYVMNVETSKEYSPINKLSDVISAVNRKFSDSTGFYLVMNDYIYMFGKKPKKIKFGYFISPAEAVAEFEDTAKCGESIYDKEFKSPKDLIGYIKRDAVEQLAGFNKRVIVDENPNNDSNIKTSGNQQPQGS